MKANGQVGLDAIKVERNNKPVQTATPRSGDRIPSPCHAGLSHDLKLQSDVE
jgi:hypothetical protein